jgi:hypothetical protein
MPRRRLRSDYICCRLTCYLTFYWKRLAEEFSSEGVYKRWLIFPTEKRKIFHGTASFALAQRRPNDEQETVLDPMYFRAKTPEKFKGYSACPYRPGYNLLRVGAVVRTSETTGHSGYTQTNSPFDFAGCTPRLQDR